MYNDQMFNNIQLQIKTSAVNMKKKIKEITKAGLGIL